MYTKFNDIHLKWCIDQKMRRTHRRAYVYGLENVLFYGFFRFSLFA